jgi:pimeloyl-ACP methyl ester carboxylesterase
VKILFSHGKESGPWGSKIKHLATISEELGCQVTSLDYTNVPDPQARVAMLLEALHKESNEVILVGSSMGGYVSLVAAEKRPVKGVFLMAPALYIDGYPQQSHKVSCPVDIVHGWKDEIIPYQNALTFAEQQACNLHLIDGDHRLNDALIELGILFKQFLFTQLTRP